MKAKPRGAKFRNLTEPDLEEIERLARKNAAETYRGPLLALVHDVRRLREVALGNEFDNASPQRNCGEEHLI